MTKKLQFAVFAPAIITVALLAGSSVEASAQDRYGFPPGVTHELIRKIARSAEDRSDDFKKELRKTLNRSGLNGSDREDRLNEQARRLERALDRVKKGVDKRESYRQVQGDVREAVRAGKDIDFTVSNRWRGSSIEREWRRLKQEVNALARTVSVGQI
jgi:hypothetical protein